MDRSNQVDSSLSDKKDIEKRLHESVLSKEKQFEGRIANVESWTVKLPDGREALREIICHPGAAAVVPVDENGMVSCVYQFRHPLGRVTLEIPAGKKEYGEDPYPCAVRELQEETGLKAEKLELLTVLATSPGIFNEEIYIYLATGLTPCSVDPDEDEFLNLRKFHIDELISMIEKGEIRDSKTIVGIELARAALARRS